MSYFFPTTKENRKKFSQLEAESVCNPKDARDVYS